MKLFSGLLLVASITSSNLFASPLNQKAIEELDAFLGRGPESSRTFVGNIAGHPRWGCRVVISDKVVKGIVEGYSVDVSGPRRNANFTVTQSGQTDCGSENYVTAACGDEGRCGSFLELRAEVDRCGRCCPQCESIRLWKDNCGNLTQVTARDRVFPITCVNLKQVVLVPQSQPR